MLTEIINLQQLGRTMSAERMKIPSANIPKFDVESEDYYAAISAAAGAEDVNRAGLLLSQWEKRLAWLHCEGCKHAPPQLVRKDGESSENYILRCYEAMP